ncbi:hypothetical protein M438DRAFT_346002 [Aureobasidium pullulans EXF-150]|uniref:Rab-GAP TBC domain-containing protein n=1 Tax=Aureobasidium pullulans EXF-150 TaxID=1043002 RepID=A0A074XPK6_AURPU|nr:uncharacterized protein M438DRAFT_346002 [Aureobasidium pullulans EXF-150]KEQ83907.1 hypothetical protein M438DRAFT_346002 [Aureobasidium pullulans EXF-150]
MLEDKPQHDGEDSGHVSPNHDASEKSSSGQPFSNSWRDEPLTPTESAKVTQILRACENKDTQQIVALATTSGGLIEDHVRRVAWPVLLGASEQKPDQTVNWQALPVHRDEEQVKLDVHRAFVYYPTGESENQIEGRKHELSNLITGLLRQHPCLHYFQGFHDIAQVLLLVLGANQAAPLLARLSLLRIRDYMLPTFSASESHVQLLPAIVYATDPKLCQHLSGLQPYFAIAATLTLYAHDIEEYGGISRLFDFLLAHEAVVSVYMYATIIMLRKDELLELGSDEEDMMYAILSKLPKPLDIESLITRTTLLYSQHPPETLPFRAWRQVSGYSVLKTTRDPNELAKQTLEDGEQLYAKHAAQIERQQALQKAIAQSRLLAYRYRKPAGALTLAVAVGVLSLYIGKSGNGSSVSSSAILLDARHKLLWVINRAWAALRL